MSKISYSLILLQFSTYFLSTKSDLLTLNCVDAVQGYIQLLRKLYPGINLPPFEIHGNECRYGRPNFPTAIRGGPTGPLLTNELCNIPPNDLSSNYMKTQKRTSILLPRVPPGGLKIDTPNRDTPIYPGQALGAPFQETNNVAEALRQEQMISHQTETNQIHALKSLSQHDDKRHLREASMNHILNGPRAGPPYIGASPRLIRPDLEIPLGQNRLYNDYERELALKQIHRPRPYGDYERNNLEILNGIHQGHPGFGPRPNNFYAQNQKMLVNHANTPADMVYLQQRKIQEEEIQRQLQHAAINKNHQNLAAAYSEGRILANPMQQEAIRQHQQTEANHVYAENRKVEAGLLAAKQLNTQAVVGQIQQEKMREEILHQQQHPSVQNHHQNDAPVGFYLLGGETNREPSGLGMANAVQTSSTLGTTTVQQSYAGQVNHEGGAGMHGLEVIPPGGVREVVKGGQKVLISNTECPDQSELCITIDS